MNYTKNNQFNAKKLAEAKRILTRNGIRFIKESERYAGKHPIFSGKEFQEYLLKECGTDCDDCDDMSEFNPDCCPDCGQDPCVCDHDGYDDEPMYCPECHGDGCEECDFTGLIDSTESFDDEYPEGISNEDYDAAYDNDDDELKSIEYTDMSIFDDDIE